MKKAVATPGSGVVTADFFEIVRQMCAKSIFGKNKLALKVKKTGRFVLNQPVLVVAGEGFEPTTSGL